MREGGIILIRFMNNGVYWKTLERERMRTKNVGSIEGFIKRKSGERGSSEEWEDIGLSLKNLNILRAPQEKRSLVENNDNNKWKRTQQNSG